ncbi:MAG: DMT family transporter [Patescibacteria group bacterium]
MSSFYKISRERSGEIFILTESILWAAFPIVSFATYQFISPIFAAAWSTFFATVFFGALVLFQKKWKELKNRAIWNPILWATFLIAVVYYALFFSGLKKTSVGNAAIIMQMEVWFSFVFFGLILRKEKYSRAAFLGAAVMFVGIFLVLFRGSFELNRGDFLILLAAAVPPAGNHFQQIARKKVSAATLLFIRSLLATPFLFLLARFFESAASQNFTAALPFLLLNGLLLFGFSKILFIEGIHRISVAKAVSLNTIVPIFTLFYTLVFFHEVPTVWQLVGLPFVVVGAILITRNNFLQTPLID